MRLPASVLLYLSEIKQSIDFERRVAATDDGFWSVTGAHSTEGFESLQRRLAVLEAIAKGKRPTLPGEPDALEL